MAQLLIRNLEPETIGRLKDRARRHRRSLQGEVKLILEQEAARAARDPWELADKIRRALADRKFSDSAAIIREDRVR